MASSPDLVSLLAKARQYCDYQERCASEVKEKLRSWEATEEQTEQILHTLENENYLNEERYVRAFALGKLRHNQWGRNKIVYALRMKAIPDAIIQQGINELEENEYEETLRKILRQKHVNAADKQSRKAKLAQFAIGKGFQPSLVWQLLNEKD